MQTEQFSPADDLLTQEEKLEKYQGDVEWSYLKAHFSSGALIYVDPCIKLKEAGLAFANDSKEIVEKWLKEGDLVQPCQQHADHWEYNNTRFNTMIVRPFVLAQPISAS